MRWHGPEKGPSISLLGKKYVSLAHTVPRLEQIKTSNECLSVVTDSANLTTFCKVWWIGGCAYVRWEERERNSHTIFTGSLILCSGGRTITLVAAYPSTCEIWYLQHQSALEIVCVERQHRSEASTKANRLQQRAQENLLQCCRISFAHAIAARAGAGLRTAGAALRLFRPVPHHYRRQWLPSEQNP